jgi:hypothetical protein
MPEEMLKNTAEAFSGGEVEITELFDEYAFKLKFVGTKGTPRNIKDFMATIEEIKPAHLAHSYKFNYNTNSDISKYTHEELSNYTHAEIRNSSELRGDK